MRRALFMLSAIALATVLLIAAWVSTGLVWRVHLLVASGPMTTGDVAWVVALSGGAVLPFAAAAATLRRKRSAGATWTTAMLFAAIVAQACAFFTMFTLVFTFAGI